MPDRKQQDRDILRAALGRSPECPPGDVLAGWSDAPADSQLGTHVESCSWCQTELKLLQSFEAAEIGERESEDVRLVTEQLNARAHEIFGTPPPVEAPPPLPWWKSMWVRPWRSPAVYVLAGCLAVVIAGVQCRHNTGVTTVRPVSTSGGALRSGTLTVVSPLGDVPKPPEAIEWQKVEGATRYEVQLMEVDKTEIWKVGTRGLRVILGPEVRNRIVPSKTILYQVTAFDNKDAKLAVSDGARFRLQ